MKLKFTKLKGSATLVVIISAVIFITYAVSTTSDVRHLKYMQEKYEKDIKEIYEKDIDELEANYYRSY